jgi:adenosyl cobinamide kinase/adenosyl cobinamide phosphate guanylyltransferase
MRLNIFLERAHARSLDALATMKRVSKSSLVAAALASYLSPDGADHREAATVRRLEKMDRNLERLERDQTILIETVALFVRHHFAITAPIPEAHHEAARAQGRVRFEQFVEQLARHLQRGESLVQDLSNEIGEGVAS